MNTTSTVLAALIVSFTACAGLAGCDSSQAPAPARAVETIVAEAATGDVLAVYSAQVVSQYSSQHGFRTGGMIVERPVDVGQEVVAGQLLARLDAGDADIRVRDAAAQLAAAQAQAGTQRAELARARQLAADGFISPAELEHVEASAESAQARLQSAQALQSGAARQRTYTELRAAQAGVVTAVRAEVGEVVPAGQPVVTVEAPGALEAAVSIPEGEVARFRSARLAVRLWTDPATSYPARIRTLSAAANPQTRTFDARVSFTAPQDLAAIGNTAEVIVQEPAPDGTMRVPLAAVVEHAGKRTAWVVSGDPPQVQPRVVVIQGVQDNALLLSSGLSPGERVVSAGAHLLQPGQLVNPVASSVSRNQ